MTCVPPKHTLVGLEQCEVRRVEGSGRGQWPTKGLHARVGFELLRSMRGKPLQGEPAR